jgi:two-component system chemotaxis response regulator CheY
MRNNKVLLLEDDRTMLPLLGKVLVLEGYQPVFPIDLQKSSIIDTILQEKPAAIFMDVHLGELNGLEFLAEMRLQAVQGSVKILMTSGLELRQECLAAGADGFLMKPFMPKELIDWLNNAIGPEEK